MTRDDLLKMLQDSSYEAYRPDYPSDMTDDEVRKIINDNKLLPIIADGVSQYVEPLLKLIKDLDERVSKLEAAVPPIPPTT
jgi:hypothetical protein